MRHRIHGRKLSRSPAHRLALRRNLAKSLFAAFGSREYIITTREKAKYVRPFAEKLITLGKEKSLHNYRRGIQLLGDETLVKKLFDEIGPRYRERPGGYLRILRTSRRRLGDKASQVLLGFVKSPGAGPAALPAKSEAE
jgi:large subunit ribosomal protein L17